MIRHRQIYRADLSQDMAHGVGIVGVEQTRAVVHDRHRSGPVEGHVPLVAPSDLRNNDFSSEIFDPTGEREVVDDEGAWVSGAQGDPPAVPGDGSDAPACLPETGGCTSRAYAPTPRILFRVRRVAEVVGDGLVSFLEAHPVQ